MSQTEDLAKLDADGLNDLKGLLRHVDQTAKRSREVATVMFRKDCHELAEGLVSFAESLEGHCATALRAIGRARVDRPDQGDGVTR